MKKIRGKNVGIAAMGLLVLFGAVAAALSGIQYGVMQKIAEASRKDDSTPVLVIDAGHGGIDGGASSADGVLESTINLEIAQKLNALAGVFGIETVMTRSDENSIHSPDAVTIHEQKVSDIKNRIKIINAAPGAFLISIHQNSFTQTKIQRRSGFLLRIGCKPCHGRGCSGKPPSCLRP
jgi:N-acetylmuramoyl-L-alanine amidase